MKNKIKYCIQVAVPTPSKSRKVRSLGCLYQYPPPARKVRSAGCPPAEGRAPRPPWNEGDAIKNLGNACAHDFPRLILIWVSPFRAVIEQTKPALSGPAAPFCPYNSWKRTGNHRVNKWIYILNLWTLTWGKYHNYMLSKENENEKILTFASYIVLLNK